MLYISVKHTDLGWNALHKTEDSLSTIKQADMCPTMFDVCFSILRSEFRVALLRLLPELYGPLCPTAISMVPFRDDGLSSVTAQFPEAPSSPRTPPQVST